MQQQKGNREVIGWKIEPKGWYPEIGLFDTQSIREAKKREREAAEAKKEKVQQ